MSGWGLLAGVGAGLSQGAQMLNQGMAEDRAVQRENEREARREAIEAAKEKAAESRWRESFEFQKQQSAESMGLQREQIKQAQSNADRQFEFAKGRANKEDTNRDQDVLRGSIDNEVKYILDDYTETSRMIERQATEEIRAAQKEIELLMRAQKSADPMSMPAASDVNVKPENIAGRIKSLGSYVNQIRDEQRTGLENLMAERDAGLAMVRSHYGDSVNQSSFAATLSKYGMLKEEADPLAKITNDASGISTLLERVGIDPENMPPLPNVTTTPPSTNPTTNTTTVPAGLTPGSRSAGFPGGFSQGFNSSRADSGYTTPGFESTQIDRNHSSKVGLVGDALAQQFGSIASALTPNPPRPEVTLDRLNSINRTLYETPAQRKARLAKP